MRGRTQVFEASAAYQVMVLAAAIDSGAVAPADRRILLVSANSAVPEVVGRLDEDPAIAPLLDRFDAVVSYNDLIAPLHPSEWRPRRPELPLHERAFRTVLDIPAEHTVEIVVESVHVPPGRSLLAIFGGACASVYAEGLMSYGATRDPLPAEMAARIGVVRYLDLIPGLAPMLLTEYGVPAEPIDEQAFRDVVATIRPTSLDELPAGPYALVLGQYLAALGLLSAKAEATLLADLVEAAAAAGHRTVVLKPHPSAPPDAVERVQQRAARLGVELVVSAERAPVEAIYHHRPPALVLGCFSTGLVTAGRYWGIPAATLGVERVLSALPKTEDSNRIPLLLVDRSVPRVREDLSRIDPVEEDGDLTAIVRAVAYAMQWRAHDVLRDEAAVTFATLPDAQGYVPRSRLRQLALPGGWPVSLTTPTFRRASDALVEVRRQQVAITAAAGRLRPSRPTAPDA